MNKDDLINQISQDQKMTKISAQKALEMSLAGITNLMKHGQNLTLVGFGSFLLLNREPRKARNPNTGNIVDVPEKNYVSFKAGENFREAINLKKALYSTRKKRELKKKFLTHAMLESTYNNKKKEAETTLFPGTKTQKNKKPNKIKRKS